MEGAILILLLVIGGVIALAVWLVARAVGARESIEELRRRLAALEGDVFRLKRENQQAPKAVSAAHEGPIAAASTSGEPVRAPAASLTATPQPLQPAPAAITPTLVTPPIIKPVPPAAAPPPVPSIRPQPQPARESVRPLVSAINWEQFMGVKLLAWVGGLAAFLAVAFFVKYSFDNNLIPPEVRMALGFVAGLGALIGGVALSRKQYAVLAHTLCGTGMVILYAVTFACRWVYHFEFFGPIPTFLLMVLITTTAFFLAVRLNAMAVAILGMLGGFLTPILLSTGVDNPLRLFGYIAILDVGLILVAVNRRWPFLARWLRRGLSSCRSAGQASSSAGNGISKATRY